MISRKLKLAILVICFLSFFLLLLLKADFTSALKPPEIQYPQIPLSDVETPNQFIERLIAAEGTEEYNPGDALGLYIRYFYSLAIILAVLAVFASIIYGGFQYLLAVGKPGLLTIARDRISSGILGLIILFSVQFILTAINPQFSVFNFTAPEPERCDCTRPQEQLSDYCKVYCQVRQPITEETPVYIEIPLGRLVERTLKASEEAKQTAIIVERKAENLRALSEELKLLTLGGSVISISGQWFNYSGCQCGDTSRVNTQCGDGCSGGICVGDPCSPDRDRINRLNNEEIPHAIEVLEQWKEQARARQISLANEKTKLEFAEILMRDSVFSPINYQSFIGLENKQVRKLNHWLDIDIGVSGLSGPNLSMPTPLAECGSASCVVCGETLFCYGNNNNNRTCETGSQFSVNGSIPAGRFPDSIALYNGVEFPVPSRGVYACNANIFGCDNDLCKVVRGPEDPATFYISEKGNEELITIIESLSLSIYDPLPPPPSTCPAGQTRPYTSCDGENCVTIDACGVNACENNSVCAAIPPDVDCPAGQIKPHTVCDNYACRTIDSCGTNSCEDDSGCGAPPSTGTYSDFGRVTRSFATPQRIAPWEVPPLTINHQLYVNSIPQYLRYNYGADCGVYVAAVVKNTIDPNYPEVGTVTQESYLRGSPNFDCFNIGNESQLRPGDILFSRPNEWGAGGHTLIWLEDGAWQASLNQYLPAGPSGWYPRMSYVCRYRNF